MTTDEQLTAIVDSWLASTNASPHTAEETVDHVAARLPQTRQRSRWWRLPSLKRTTSHPADKPSTDYNASSVQVANGHSSSVTGRTQSMFSPAKAITAGALIFAIGSAFLIAQPFDQQSAVPGAETPIATPVEVTGRMVGSQCGGTPTEGNEAELPGAYELWTCDGVTQASDPRLEGTFLFMNEEQWFVGNGLETSERLAGECEADFECDVPGLDFRHTAVSIENDRGVWRQRPVVAVPWGIPLDIPDRFQGSQLQPIQVFDGEGDFDGLIAMLEVSTDGSDEVFWGFILDARQLKPAPENASTK